MAAVGKPEEDEYAERVADAYSQLGRFLDDVDDQVALVGVLRSPFFSLSDDALFALGETPARSLCDAPPAYLAEEQQDRIRFAARVLGTLREKKNRLPVKLAGESKSVEIGAVWSVPDEKLQGGRLKLDLSNSPVPMAAATPGLQ